MQTNKARIIAAVSYLLVVLVVVGMVCWLVQWVRDNEQTPVTQSTAITLSYEGVAVTEASGITLRGNGEDNVFLIESETGFGAYTVADCTVKVVPNVGNNRDFDFSLTDSAGKSLTYRYSAVKDLTKAFSDGYNGKSVAVASDGTFSLNTDCGSMTQVLRRLYSGVVLTEDADVSAYPYFALSVTTPDGKQTVKIPFRLPTESADITMSISCTAISGTYDLTDAPAIPTYLCVNDQYEAATFQLPYTAKYGLTSGAANAARYSFSTVLTLTEEAKAAVIAKSSYFSKNPDKLEGEITFTDSFDLGYNEVARLFLCGFKTEEQDALIENEFFLEWVTVLEAIEYFDKPFFRFTVTAENASTGDVITDSFYAKLDTSYLYHGG